MDMGALAFAFPDEGVGTYEISELQITNATVTTVTEQWTAGGIRGSGTITIDSVDDQRFVGTLEFELEAEEGTSPAVLSVSDGVFDVEQPAPQPAWASELSVAGVDDLVAALEPGPDTLPFAQRERVSSLLAQVRHCDVNRRSPLRTDAIELRRAGYDLVDQGLNEFDANTPEVLELRRRYSIQSDVRSGEHRKRLTDLLKRR